MKKIFLLAMASVLTMGMTAYATGNPKGHSKRQPGICQNCPEKVCTPACKDHCDKSCCHKSK